jgi:hypothetical protein
MKNKVFFAGILSMALVFGLVLVACPSNGGAVQKSNVITTPGAGKYEREFVNLMSKNNLKGIEKLLRTKANKTDLSSCLGSVLSNKVSGFNRYNALDVIKLLIQYGVEVNQNITWFQITGRTTWSTGPSWITLNSPNKPLTVAIEMGASDEVIAYLRGLGAEENPVRFIPPTSSVPASPAPPTAAPASTVAPASTPGVNPAQALADAISSPLRAGTYGLSGSDATINIASIGKSGIMYYTYRGNSGNGSYTINGDTMTVQMGGYTFVYTINSATMFSGNGETWVRTGL